MIDTYTIQIIDEFNDKKKRKVLMFKTNLTYEQVMQEKEKNSHLIVKNVGIKITREN